MPTSDALAGDHDPSPIAAFDVRVDGQLGPLPGTHQHYGISHPGRDSFL